METRLLELLVCPLCKGPLEHLRAEHLPVVPGMKQVKVPDRVDFFAGGDRMAGGAGQKAKAAVFLHRLSGFAQGPALFHGQSPYNVTVLFPVLEGVGPKAQEKGDVLGREGERGKGSHGSP